jgi:UDP-GlcNAc3NAcA epimerase
MKLISVIGARPQFIKAAAVSKRLKENRIDEKIVHTGQHYDFNMSDIFFKELDIAEPDYYLGIGSGSHGEQTGAMLASIEKVLIKEKPDVVIVYGDTNTTLAGALAAAKLHIPVAHVEAGLRSFNKKMPEEINRVLTDHVSDFLFSPTETGLKNLKSEGFSNISRCAGDDDLPPAPYLLPLCINVGDVMFDIALEIKKLINEQEVLERWGLRSRDFILVTVHRAENTDTAGNLENIWNTLRDLAKSGKKVFFPMHPRTRKALETHKLMNTGKKLPRGLIISEPVSYMDMIALESNARIIITDSGGVQKEGYFFKTPCVIVREQTEWVELVETGWTILTGADREKIVTAVVELWQKKFIKKDKNFFGKGNASRKIARILMEYGSRSV